MVADSKIAQELKDQFRNGKNFGKIRGIRVMFKNKKDVESAKELIGMKLSLK